MKKIITTLAMATFILSAQINAATTSPFDGLLLTAQDSLANEKQRISMLDSMGASKSYKEIIKNRTSAILNGTTTDFIEQFALANGGVSDKKSYFNSLWTGQSTTQQHTIRLDYASGFCNNLNAYSLIRAFDDNTVMLGDYYKTISLASVAKFDIVQRVLRVLFSNLGGLAAKYAAEYANQLNANTSSTAFISADPLSQLYNHILSKIDTDSTIANKANAKKYVIDSGLQLKRDFLDRHPTPRRATGTPQGAPTRAISPRWKAVPWIVAAGAYWYLSAAMAALDDDSYKLAGSIDEVVLVSAISGGVGLVVKKLKEKMVG